MKPALSTAWRWTRRLAPWVLAALVLGLVAHLARGVDWPAVWQLMRTRTVERLLPAAALVLASYALYASFDLVGRRLTRHDLPAGQVLGVAAISYAFNLNFGAWVGALGMRLRLYTRLGVPAATVAQVIGHSLVTNWLGFLWVGGALLLCAPLPTAGLPPGQAAQTAIGAAMLGAALAYGLLCRFSRRREWTVRGHVLRLAQARVALWQAAVGGGNWLLMGAIVWTLLNGRIDYPAVLGALMLAAVAGVVTHVPGGLGVIEAVLVATLGDRLPTTELLTAALAYRACYFLMPLLLALPAYALVELSARRR